MIKINNLQYKINNRKIIDNINASFNEGEITGIIGRSGAGKSTLIKLIAGTDKNYTGEIHLGGTEAKSISFKEIHKYIACHFNDSGQDIIDDTVFNFLIQSRKPYKKMLSPFSDFDVQLTEDYINIFGLNEHRDSKVLSLPGGVLKKTLLAFSFIKDSNALILDNPTTGLDLQSLMLLQKAVLRYAINGDKLVIIAGNDVNFILQTADRILIMKDGEIEMEMIPGDIDAGIVRKCFNADVFISRNIYNGKPGIQQYLQDEG